MRKVLTILVMLVSLGFTNPAPTQQGDPLIINNAISLLVPVKYETNEELTRLLSTANDKIIYAAVLTTAAGKVPFAVSVYHNEAPTDITKAFKETVHFKAPDTKGYKLVDWGTYQKDNKTLRYKISEISFDSGKTNSVMYYFMKGDASTDLYEIKISGNSKGRGEQKKLLEKIALSLKFL